jgi:hypothetical protein
MLVMGMKFFCQWYSGRSNIVGANSSGPLAVTLPPKNVVLG